ncbi:phage baseplate assembly protein domain-containing protein [Acinetobacter pittii]|uniref:phage baseplate assembly protein domain-containing protein n=1 Tax=Acinetobacter pittii TaxID=48296 RepID=UPI000A3B3882|nr:phage baseplate assembly protein [Acinetobacter pittii]MCE6628016.1 phage baseplate assembly protein [Acinetobacter pittii]OTU38067.1 baseplate assembly protein [Acinetobacter pittii]
MIQMVQRQINKALGQIRQSFQGIVARGGSKVLQLTGLSEETLQEVELFQQVGFSSYIPEGSRVVVLPLQGKTSRSIVIATTGGPVVINVSEGETCIYDQFGHSVWLKEDGAHIKGGDLFVDEGNLHVPNGDVFDKNGSMQEMRDAYNPHTHGNSPPPSEPME